MEISEKVFKAEIAMCQKLFKKQKGCAWGKCHDCAVIPLLYKLHRGEIIEDSEGVKRLKSEIFNK